MTKLIHLSYIIIALLTFIGCSSKNDDKEEGNTMFSDSILNTRGGESKIHLDDIRMLSSREYESDTATTTNMAWDLCNRLMPDSVKKYATIAYKYIQNKQDTSALNVKVSLAELELIFAYMQAKVENNQDSAEVLINRCISTFEKADKPLRLIECNIYLAEINRLKNDHTTGYTYLKKIDQIYKTISDKEITDIRRFNLLTGLAKMSIQLGLMHFGGSYLRNASILYDQVSDESKANFLQLRALLQFYHQDYSQSDYTSRRLETLAKSLHDNNFLKQAYIIKGLSLSRLGFNDEAQTVYNSIDSLNKLMPEKYDENFNLLQAEIDIANNKLEEARYLLFDTLNTLKYMSHENSLLESQKKYYISQGDYQSALDVEYRERMNTEHAYNIVATSNGRDTELLENEYKRLQQNIDEARGEKESILGSHNQERVIFGTLVVVISVIIIIYKKNERRRNNEKVQKEYARLKDDINQKVAQLKHQKEALLITNNRISESFRYAERIQHSIMPHPEELNKYPITGSFVFHSPLDVVSGDFFWFLQKGDNLIVCCADCTGHGVPGAFMSMIASTLLNGICHKAGDNITPAEILTQLDAKLIEILAQNQAEDGASKDGLDIAIVSINLKTKMVISSAARRPIIMIKDQEIINIKGSRRSIGDTEQVIAQRPFVDTATQLHTGDTIYMYTDGYSDQFGGSNCKKMKSNKIKKFLRTLHDDDMEEQCLTVQELFTQWKGDNPQTDDVLFIGLKI